MVFEPVIVLHPFRKVVWTIPSVRGGQRQTKLLKLFAKGRSFVSPVKFCANFSISQCPKVKIELRWQHVEVTAFKHREIDEPLVLLCMCPTTPVPVIGRKREIFINIDRIKRKHSAIEFCRIVAVGVAAKLVAEKLIVSTNLPFSGFCVRFLGINEDITSVPEITPPLSGFGHCCFICQQSFFIDFDQSYFPCLSRWRIVNVQTDREMIFLRRFNTLQFPSLIIGIGIFSVDCSIRFHVITLHRTSKREVSQRIPKLIFYRIKTLLFYCNVKQRFVAVPMVEKNGIALKSN